MGSPPLRARMSGAVSRLISSCADMGGSLERRSAEHRDADHERMKDKTQREIKQGPDDERDDVVAVPAGRDERCTRVGSALERGPVVAGPGEKRAEQQDRAEIAIRYEVRHRPCLHTD